MGGKKFKFDTSTKKWIIQKKGKQPTHAQELRNKLVAKATKQELIFKGLLRYLGIHHEFQKHIRTDTQNRFADFSIPALKLIIEIDGGYHTAIEQQTKDRDREKEIKRATGYNIVRFTNAEVENNPNLLFETLIDLLRNKFKHLKDHWDKAYL